MNAGLQEQCADSTPAAPDGNSSRHRFVSSTLSTWTTAKSEWFARDVQIDDTVYRRLDPEYYAWLRSRMVLAKKAATAGHLDVAAFEDLRIRFNAVHEWAVQHLGEERLLTAVGTLRAGDYKPPMAEDESRHVALPRASKSADHISPEAIAMVDAISERASAWVGRAAQLAAAGLSRPRVSSAPLGRPRTRWSGALAGPPGAGRPATICAESAGLVTRYQCSARSAAGCWPG